MRFVPVPITGGPTDGKRVLFSVWETRVKDYEVFAKATNRKIRPLTGYKQASDHPVINVSWEDANAFCEWLTSRYHDDGRLDSTLVFRLPTDHEWSCAVGIGGQEDPDAPPHLKSGRIRDLYPWGTEWPPPPGAGNYYGDDFKVECSKETPIQRYRDGFAHSAPVGQFKPNPFGLYDLGGNVMELTDDLFDSNQPQHRQSTRGRSHGDSTQAVMFASNRNNIGTTEPFHDALGFRVVIGQPIRPITASTTQARPTVSEGVVPATATKETPFENSFGMRFVPVPITGGPTDGKRVLFSIWETRVKDYRAFALATGHLNRKQPLHATDDHPQVYMTWEDAKAYCVWLTEQDRLKGSLAGDAVYRLPTDHEWSCAVGIGDREDPNASPVMKNNKIRGVYPWGTDWPPPAGAGNFRGQEVDPAKRGGHPPLESYDDGYEFTAPVGLFTPNPLGLFDLVGNVAEWCEDWYDPTGADRKRVYRGLGFGYSHPVDLGSSCRSWVQTTAPSHDALGFRVVLGPPVESP